MSEIEAAFAERSIGYLENTLYGHMENYGYMYTHKWSQFVKTLNSRKNGRQIGYQKLSEIPTFYHFCTTSYNENIQNPCLKLETELSSPSMTYLSGGVISRVSHEKFLISLRFLPENLQHTQ